VFFFLLLKINENVTKKAVPAGQATLEDGADAWKMMRESGIAPNCRTYSAMLTFLANVAVAERSRSRKK
jgi:hypothetical protein